MEDDKLKRLAVKVVDLLPSEMSSLQDCYDEFRELYKAQKDYWSRFRPEDLIKLVFYLYSYNKTKDFKLSDKQLNNLAFISLFTTEGNHHHEECDYCLGGEARCDTCDRTGEISCEACDGTGEIDGEECDNCGGYGEISCHECGGDGEVSCEDCGGDGTVETDKFEIFHYYICTWDKYIKDSCELREGSLEPALSEYEFDRLRDDYIILYPEEKVSELKDSVEENEMYCTSYEDEPRLTKTTRNLTIYWDDDESFDSYRV